jgi:mono/diheme cytochrome c family protein
VRNRVVALAVGLALAGALAAGCGGEDSTETTATPPAPAEPTPAEPAPEPTPAAPDAAAGAAIFESAGCGACHTLAAAGASGSVGPNLDELAPDLDTVIAQVTNGGGGMPAFGGDLSEQEIESVAAFVVESTSGGASGGDGEDTSGSGEDGENNDSDGEGGRAGY